MNAKPYQTMVSLCRHLGIQVLLFGPDYRQIEEIDYGFRGKMFKNFDYGTLADAMERNLETDIYYMFKDDLNLHYTIFCLPEGEWHEPEERICCIGPFLYEQINSGAVLELADKLKVPPQLRQDFMEFYYRIPTFPSYHTWNQLIGFFLRQAGLLLDFRRIDEDELHLFSTSGFDYCLPELPDVALKAIEERYKWENALMAAVSAGNLQQSMDAYHRFRQYRLVPRVADPIREQKNLLFTFNTLLRKAVERGHVHPLHIDSLSRQLNIQIESSITLEQLESLPHTMIRKYCILVNNYSRRTYSSLVQTCMDYIDFHYSTDMSLSSLASMCSVSSSYLSSLFKKEAGMTITDYIHYTRIRQSLTMLNASSLSVSEIAALCGFSDANYFTRTFKKLQGKTPKAYREEMGIG